MGLFNPGPFACQAKGLPLSYSPSPLCKGSQLNSIVTSALHFETICHSLKWHGLQPCFTRTRTRDYFLLHKDQLAAGHRVRDKQRVGSRFCCTVFRNPRCPPQHVSFAIVPIKSNRRGKSSLHRWYQVPLLDHWSAYHHMATPH